MGQSSSVSLSTRTGQVYNLSNDEVGQLISTGEVADLKLDVLTDESILILQHYVRNLIKTIAEVLAKVDKMKADTLIKETEKQLEQMSAKKKGGFLGLLMKIFTAIATALGFIACLIAPSPATIALLALSVAVMMDLFISEACGKDSLVSQAINALMKELMQALGEKLGAAMGALIMVIIAVISVVIFRNPGGAANAIGKAVKGVGDAAKAVAASEAGAGLSAALSRLQSMVGEQLKNLVTSITESCDKMMKFFSDLMKGKNLQYFVDLLEYTFFAAKSGVDIAGSVNQIDIAKLLKMVEDLSAEAEYISNICEAIKNGLKREYERLGTVNATIAQLNPVHA